MARPRTAKVEAVKEKLLARLADPLRPAGARFLSARAVAALYGISYQTAHRLLAELKIEGKLSRRPASGTYRPGSAIRFAGVQLVFHERAKRGESFGAHLLHALRERIERDRVDVRLTWYRDRVPRLLADRIPVLWESPLALRQCVDERRIALLLNDRPPPGMDSLHVDSVGVDDYSGGACAGQLLTQRCGPRGRFVIVAGPADDRRSIARVEGCRANLGKEARVIHANGWYLQNGLDVGDRALAEEPDGIFCCNDRLAQGLTSIAARGRHWLPDVIGFDDAPVAETLGLTTIAVPWRELTASASAVTRRRLAGDAGAASHQVVMPRPVIRWASNRKK
jgi:hypothetical protein